MTYNEAWRRLSAVMKEIVKEDGPTDRWFELRAERAQLEAVIAELER